MQEIHDAVDALLPEIAGRGDEIAELRRLPTDLVSSLRAAGAMPGDQPSLEVRHALTLSRANSFRTAREVTQLMGDTVGGSSIYATHPIARLLRDISTLNQHVMVQDRMLEMVGASMLAGAAMLPVF